METKINLDQGLTSNQAAEALQRFGPNQIVEVKKLAPLVDFLLRFKNPLIILLMIAAVISLFVGDPTSSVIIMVMIIASAFIDFYNTYRSQKAAEKLRQRVEITSDVLRDGKRIEIPVSLLVPGDVVLLSAGDIIPADGNVLDGRDLFVNESQLTGESFPVEKFADSKAFMGSSVVTGEGRFKVMSTGKSTKLSQIAQVLTRPQPPTNFEKGITDFSYLIVRVTFMLLVVIFFVNALLKHEVLNSFLFALALAVGLTPEMLPMIIALNLSKGSMDMSKHGVIVKKLSAIQNFGSMDVLCTDKTGTLTEDKISLIKYLDYSGNISEDVFRAAYVTSAYTAGLHSPLDSAIKEHRTLALTNTKKVDEIPFDYPRKRSSMVIDEGTTRTILTKGAPEEVIAVCSRIKHQTGAIDLSEEIKETVMRQYRKLSEEGFRVLAVSERAVSEYKETYNKDDEKDMEFLGLLAFLDPPKHSVKDTLKRMEAFGIEIKILTGDNEFVSKKIASEIELPVKGMVLGPDLIHMSDEVLRHKVESATIFARVTPDQKQRIISCLKHNSHVVGYLGDGINDAPSLRAADVSISVDNAVDVAKETADLILLRKSLSQLVEGIVEGRRTFSNTLKYMMMNLSSNFGNMFSMAAASIILPFLPMLPVQILLNNLLYDTSQLSIPLDNVDSEDIARPRRLDIAHIRKFMYTFGPISSVFDFMTFIILYWGFHYTHSFLQTGWFLESIATQTLVVYIIRTRKLPFIKSRPSLPLVISSVGIVVLSSFIALSFIGKWFKFTPLPLPVLLTISLLVVIYLFAVEAIKHRFYRTHAV
ncbi:MAG: magnesium-translocating P-type ATPase [Acidobacteriaceae bacterium]